MYKFEVGQKVRVIGDIHTGDVFTIEDEDSRRMSSGVKSVPTYYHKGTWIFEWDLEFA